MTKPTVALYARVSSTDQRLESQRLTLREWTKAQGYTSLDYVWYLDKVTGTTDNRPELQRLLRDIDKGKIKVLAFCRLDRLSRSTIEGLRLLSRFAQKEIRVISILQGIDFNGSMGKFLATLFLSIAELERDTIVARVTEGLQAAKARGVKLGRKPDLEKRAEIKRLKESGLGVTQIAHQLGITRQSVYRML